MTQISKIGDEQGIYLVSQKSKFIKDCYELYAKKLENLQKNG